MRQQKHIPNQAEKDFIAKLKGTQKDNNSNAYDDVKALFQRLFLNNPNETEARYFTQITDTVIFSLLCATNYKNQDISKLVENAGQNLFGENPDIPTEEKEYIFRLAEILQRELSPNPKTIFNEFITILKLADQTPSITPTTTSSSAPSSLSASSSSIG